MSASPAPARTPLAWKLLGVAGALLLVPGGAFLAAANAGTGGRVAIGVAVAWWVIASAILGRTALRRWPDVRGPVRGTLAVAAVASVATTFVLTRDEEVDERIATGAPPAAASDRGSAAPPPDEPERAPPPRNVEVLAGRFTVTYTCYCAGVAQLTHRTQVLLDEDRHQRLRQRAQRTGSSIGELVREAIDLAYPTEEPPLSAAEAAGALLDSEPIPVDDWPVMKAERNEMWEEHLFADVEGEGTGRG